MKALLHRIASTDGLTEAIITSASTILRATGLPWLVTTADVLDHASAVVALGVDLVDAEVDQRDARRK